MAVHQPSIRQHLFPAWLELLGAAILGAVLLLGLLLVAGHPDLLPGVTGAQITTPADASAVGRATALAAQAQAEQARAIAQSHAQRGVAMAAQAKAQAARLGAIGSAVRASAFEAQAMAEQRMVENHSLGH